MSDPRQPSPFAIQRCVTAYQRAHQILATDGEFASDERVMALALEANPESLPPDDILRRTIAAIVWCEARSTEAKVMADGLKARKDRYHRRAQAMREQLQEIMQALDRHSFSGSPLATVSLADAPASSVIIDEELIPAEYFEIIRKLDKRKLLDDLRVGLVIEGAVLSNPTTTLRMTKAKASAAIEPEQEDA